MATCASFGGEGESTPAPEVQPLTIPPARNKILVEGAEVEDKTEWDQVPRDL